MLGSLDGGQTWSTRAGIVEPVTIGSIDNTLGSQPSIYNGTDVVWSVLKGDGVVLAISPSVSVTATGAVVTEVVGTYLQALITYDGKSIGSSTAGIAVSDDSFASYVIYTDNFGARVLATNGTTVVGRTYQAGNNYGVGGYPATLRCFCVGILPQ